MLVCGTGVIAESGGLAARAQLLQIISRGHSRRAISLDIATGNSPTATIRTTRSPSVCAIRFYRTINASAVGRVMGSRGHCQVGRLHYKNDVKANIDRGGITIVGQEINTADRTCVRIGFKGIKLDKKDFFGKSDPYLVICKPTAAEYTAWVAHAGGGKAGAPGSVSAYTDQRQRLWTGPVIKNTLDPVWAVETLALQSLCGPLPQGVVPGPGPDPRLDSVPLIIECYDWDRDSAHDLIGVTECLTLGQIVSATGAPWTFHKKAKKAGQLHITQASVFRQPTVLEYVAGGCQLNLTIAVDFTGSNGHPRDPRSLHYTGADGAHMTLYGQAIASVGSILQEYDSDKMFLALGFGGEIPPSTETTHCFPLAGPSAWNVPGIDGVLGAYHQALQFVALSGPTYFAPLLRRVVEEASAGGCPTQQNQKYTTLLLLTDGAVCDIEETSEVIVDAANGERSCAATGPVPISIVIVGIGSADFSTMEFLDGDGGRLKDSSGRVATRDIVQFVPFSKFTTSPQAASLLASEVLAEIPSQMVNYFTSKGIMPNPPPPPPVQVAIPTGAGAGAGFSYPPEVGLQTGMQQMKIA